MRIILFVQIAFGFCCILFAAPVAAQKEQIALPFSAKPDETFKVRVTTTDRRTSGGALRLHTVRTGAYDGRVLEAAAAGYTISWALKSFENRIIEDKAGEAAAKAQLSGDLVAKVFQDVPVVFETNAAGLPIRVREWQPLATSLANSMRAQLGKALKERFSATPSGKSQAEAEKAIESQVDQMIKALILRHDERTATALFQEALLLGGVQHRELPLGKPVEWAGLAPALVSDGQVPFTTKVTLASAERAKGFAVVTWRSDYDANQLKAPMFELLRSQLKAAGVTDENKIMEALKPVEAMRLSRVDTGEARIDMKDGWAKQLEFVKVVSTEATQGAPDVRETKMVIEVSKP